MRILHVTDLHFQKPWYRWVEKRAKEFDVVCMSGDWIVRVGPLPASPHEQARWCRDWLAAFPGVLVGCSGNHDWWEADEGIVDACARGRWLHMARRAGVLLDEEGSIGGMDFYATQWRESLCLYPHSPVVLLTHEPPHGYPVAQSLGRDCGDVDVMDTAGRLPEGSIVLCGHIHEPRRWCSRIGDSWCFNPGCDRDSEVPNHVVIDTGRKVAIATIGGHEMPPRSLAL